MSESIIVIGGGGHARVVLDVLRCSGHTVAGILDDGLPVGTVVDGAVVLGPVSAYESYLDHRFLLAIGSNAVRRRLAEQLPVRWHTAVHPRAVLASNAQIGAGTVIMANAVVNPGAAVGAHCILNTACVVEHDNRIGDFVHLSPRAALGGAVTIGAGTHVGIGAVVRNHIQICGSCVIGAGAAVVKDITESGTYVGVPAKKK